MVDFYFDFISPYAYFAWRRVGPMCADLGVDVRVHPVLFAGMLDHWGQLGPAEIPAKRAFTFRDVARYAAMHRVPLQGPKHHPFNPLTALRVSLEAVAAGDQFRVISALFDAGWGRGADLGNVDHIAAILTEAGLDGMGLVAKTRQADVKDQLRRSTEAAIARGVFGVPTVIYQDELLWGNDRLDYLPLIIEGKDPLPSDVADKLLAITPSTTRPGARRDG